MDSKLAWILGWLRLNFQFIHYVSRKKEEEWSGWDYSIQKHTTCPSAPGSKYLPCGLMEEMWHWDLHGQTLGLKVFLIKPIILPILSDVMGFTFLLNTGHPILFPYSLLSVSFILCLPLGWLRKFMILNKKKTSRPNRRLWKQRPKLVCPHCYGLSRPEFFIFLCISFFQTLLLFPWGELT